MKITRVSRKVNGNEDIFYRYQGKEYEKLSQILKEEFKDQGEFYHKIAGVDREKAYLAGWHPDHRNFSTECDGWEKFIEDEGRINEEIIEEQVDVLDEVLKS